MQKTCRQCAEQYEITPEDLDFYKKVSPVFNGKTYLIPPPTLCPDCRQQRRLVHRNQNKLYKRKCDYSGEEMISLYSEDKPFKVYREDIWWSDKWDPMEYGRDVDFSKPFFQQLEELQKAVPRRGMHQDGTNENCTYITFGSANKNCYLMFASFYCQNVYYTHMSGMLKDCLDCYICVECELCYECMDCAKCYECVECQDCLSCHDSYFMNDCRNCHHCIGCKGLRNKDYFVNNQQVTKEEFEAKKAEVLKNYQQEKANFKRWKLQFPFVYAHTNQSENSDGDFLDHAKNCHCCFDIVLSAQDSKYCQFCGWNGKDMYDCLTTGKDSELLYEMAATTGAYHSAFNNFFRNGVNTYYSNMVGSCKNCFGCIGLNHKEYCILNKQYSKEEYEKIVPQIIELMIKNKEWGEFFPASMSPFDYNETLAQEYFPLTKEQAQAQGFKWKEETSITDSSVPAANDVRKCHTCGKNYRVIANELDQYKRLNISIPENCFECRYAARRNERNPRHLWSRECAKCQAPIQTTYSPDRPEIVYCEDCYLQTVY